MSKDKFSERFRKQQERRQREEAEARRRKDRMPELPDGVRMHFEEIEYKGNAHEMIEHLMGKGLSLMDAAKAVESAIQRGRYVIPDAQPKVQPWERIKGFPNLRYFMLGKEGDIARLILETDGEKYEYIEIERYVQTPEAQPRLGGSGKWDVTPQEPRGYDPFTMMFGGYRDRDSKLVFPSFRAVRQEITREQVAAYVGAKTHVS